MSNSFNIFTFYHFQPIFSIGQKSIKMMGLLLLGLSSTVFGETCQITGPLPIPVSLTGCTYSGSLPPDSTSYIQNTGSPTISTQTFSVEAATVTGSFSLTYSTPSKCAEFDSTGKLVSASAACGTGTGGGGVVVPSTYTWSDVSISSLAVSTITNVSRIEWADGTVQISSPSAGGSSSGVTIYPATSTASFPYGADFSTTTIGGTIPILSTSTLQSGTTFFTSSGTASNFYTDLLTIKGVSGLDLPWTADHLGIHGNADMSITADSLTTTKFVEKLNAYGFIFKNQTTWPILQVTSEVNDSAPDSVTMRTVFDPTTNTAPVDLHFGAAEQFLAPGVYYGNLYFDSPIASTNTFMAVQNFNNVQASTFAALTVGTVNIGTRLSDIATSTSSLYTLANGKVNYASMTATIPLVFNPTTGVFDIQKVSLSSAVTGSLPAASIAAGSLGVTVMASSVAINAIGTTQIADNSINNAKMADDAIAAAEMADADHGDVAWASNVATVQNVAAANIAAGSLGATVMTSSVAINAVGATQIAANSVYNSEMGDDAIGAAEMADADHGDVAWSGGVATVQNVAAANVAAGSLGATVIASSIAIGAVGNAQLTSTINTTFSDITTSTNALKTVVNTKTAYSSFSATIPLLYNPTNGAFDIQKVSLSSAVMGNLPAASIAAGSLGSTVMASSVAAATVGILQLSATGSPDGTVYLRGDNTWTAPAGTGDAVVAATQTWTGGNTFTSSTTFRGTVVISSGIRLATSDGTNGQVLTSGGADTVPTWTTPAAADNLGNGTGSYGVATSTGGFSAAVSIGTDLTVTKGIVATTGTFTSGVTAGSATITGGSGMRVTYGAIAATATFTSGVTADSGTFNTALMIPNGTAPTVDAVGEITMDSTDGVLIMYDGTSAKVVGFSTHCFSVNVSSGLGFNGLNEPVWTAPPEMAVTITQIKATSLPTGTTVIFQLDEAASSFDSAGTNVFSVAYSSAIYPTTTTTSFANAGIAAASSLVLNCPAASATGGTPRTLYLNICYQRDRE